MLVRMVSAIDRRRVPVLMHNGTTEQGNLRNKRICGNHLTGI